MKPKLLAVLTTVLTGSFVLTAPVPTMASNAYNNTPQVTSAIGTLGGTGYQVVSSEINPVILTTTDFQNLSVDQQKAVSTNWRLTPTEYSQYLSDMQNSPDGLWYKNLDPAEVLLINAKTDQERDHYADIVVKLVHDRGERELAAQLAYQNAWQRLYPNLPRIRLNQDGANSSDGMIRLVNGDSLLFFTGLNEADGNQELQALIATVKNTPGITLKIMITGKASVSDIEHWANAQQIPIDLYNANRITLGQDNGALQKLTNGQVQLPTLLLQHNDSISMISIDQLTGGV